MDKVADRKPTIFKDRLANSWPDFVDCDTRLKTEAPFLLQLLLPFKSGIILDAATGMGCESAFLLSKGFKVLSNEIDKNLIQLSFQTAKKTGVTLDLLSFDWRQIDRSFRPDSLDCILLMGNSLCLLDTVEEIKQVLSAFQNILRPNGCLIVDERNFVYTLKNSQAILNGKFRYSRKYIYCGTEITGRPIAISEDRVTFGYFSANNDLLGELSMYPFKYRELQNLLSEAGFTKVDLYSDFQSGFNPTADFYSYAAYK